jgi:hypothetical protein
MSDHLHYVPVLKARRGEFTALEALNSEARSRLTPLLEVPPIPWDFEHEVPAKSLDDHLGPVAANIARFWGKEQTFYIDFSWIAEEESSGGTHPVTSVMNELRELGTEAIPVVGASSPGGYSAAVKDVVGEDQRGACLRLDRDDLRRLNALAGLLADASGAIDAPADEIDLILDFKDFDAGQASAIEIAAAAALSSIPDPGEWRSLTLVGGAFPLNLSGLASEAQIQRADWDVWRTLAISRGDELPRRPAFGDYAVQHPEPDEIDPRLMKMSAAIRYATPAEWLILKKKNVQDHGWEQFHDLSAELIQRDEYRGADFSDGDQMIEACANRASGTGNATTWRKIATNHHIATVVDQLASLS